MPVAPFKHFCHFCSIPVLSQGRPETVLRPYASFNIYAPVTCPTEACAKGCSNISRILRPRRLRSGRPPSLPCSEKASSTYHTFVLIVRLLVLR